MRIFLVEVSSLRSRVLGRSSLSNQGRIPIKQIASSDTGTSRLSGRDSNDKSYRHYETADKILSSGRIDVGLINEISSDRVIFRNIVEKNCLSTEVPGRYRDPTRVKIPLEAKNISIQFYQPLSLMIKSLDETEKVWY